MDTIRNYLDNMFMNLPHTEQVMKARNELGQMMEDKYNELRSEGKSDNEAAGIVISEFGNLEELAESLGIDDQVAIRNQASSNAHPLSLQDVREYMMALIQSSVLIGVGVMLVICAPGAYMIFENHDNAAIIAFFAALGIGVGFIVFGGMHLGEWGFINKEKLQLDFRTAEYIKNEKHNFRTQYAVYIAVGVMLCILSCVPAAVVEGRYANIAQAALFLMIGLAVMLFIMAGMRQDAYNRLLDNTARSSGVDTKRYTPMGQKVMSVYWSTVTCLYFCISFLTFRWDISWIIWPVAAAARGILEIVFRRDHEEAV